MSSLLFITSSCLGDAVLTTGLLSHFIHHNPTTDITVACGATPAPLFEGVPHLKKCIVINRQTWSRHWFKLWRETCGQKWTSIIDLRGTALSFFLRCETKRWVWSAIEKKGHQVERVSQVMNLTPPSDPHIWTLPHHEKEADNMLRGKKHVIAVSPASNWIPKTWPLSHWKLLLQNLISDSGLFPGASVLLMGATHEKSYIHELTRMLPEYDWIDSVGRTPLISLYACLKRSSLFVGNDSGLMHLAAASGCPTIGLFGPTSSEQYAPWGQKTAIAQVPGFWQDLRKEVIENPTVSVMARLSVEEVVRKISGLLEG